MTERYFLNNNNIIMSIWRLFYFRFPKEPNLIEQWIDATGRENWMPTKTSTICSKHFTEKDYVPTVSGPKYLKFGAVPQEKVVHIVCMSVCILSLLIYLLFLKLFEIF